MQEDSMVRDRQTNRQTDRQTEIETETETDTQREEERRRGRTEKGGRGRNGQAEREREQCCLV